MRLHVSFVQFFVLSIVIVAGCEKSKPVAMKPEASLDQVQAASASDTTVEPNTAVLYVHGMGCPQCAYNVDLQLLKITGVKNVKVDMSTGRVTAQYDPNQPPTRDQLAAAINETGFTLVKVEMR